MTAQHYRQSTTVRKDRNFIDDFLQRKFIAVITVDRMQARWPAGCVVWLLKKLKLQSRIHWQTIPSAWHI
jgi:hypothetical protein